MKDLKSLDLDELRETVLLLGEKKYRADQLYTAIHKNLIDEIDDISNISKGFKNRLIKEYKIGKIEIVKRLESKIDGTVKYLFRLEDGHIIESVFMKYKHGNSVCLSTQVGCRMGCSFCASTKRGLVRNLEASEILSQYYMIKKDISEKIGNIVLMGSGEPLDNFKNVIKFLHLINSENGQNIGYRNITISTCGVAERIYQLADMKIPVNLAISLHNPFDEERNEVMPIGKKYPIEAVLDSCEYYFNQVGRRITFEYTLIDGVNDKRVHAEKLASICKKMNCHINLIPLNEVREYTGKKSKDDSIINFKKALDKLKVNATVRRELGSDINAACGQLRIDFLEGKESF